MFSFTVKAIIFSCLGTTLECSLGCIFNTWHFQPLVITSQIQQISTNSSIIEVLDLAAYICRVSLLVLKQTCQLFRSSSGRAIASHLYGNEGEFLYSERLRRKYYCLWEPILKRKLLFIILCLRNCWLTYNRLRILFSYHIHYFLAFAAHDWIYIS